MGSFMSVIGIAGSVLVLCLAALGAAGLASALIHHDDRAAKARERDAQRRIQDLGHQAQLQIMREALRRSSERADRPESGPSIIDGWDVR